MQNFNILKLVDYMVTAGLQKGEKEGPRATHKLIHLFSDALIVTLFNDVVSVSENKIGR
jgi:hypothetical protein